MHKEITELLGTFIFVLLGIGAAIMAAGSVGALGIALAMGLAWMAASYITGGHLNPAITFGQLLAGATDLQSCLRLIVAQVVGATAAIYVITLLAGDTATGANGFAAGSEVTAFTLQAIAACLFVLMSMRVAANKSAAGLGGLLMGLMLSLTVIVAGTAVNPAQSVGSAIFAGGAALDQLWLFIVAPAVGAGVAAIIVKNGLLDAPAKGKKK